RFYGAIHWKRHPGVLAAFWSHLSNDNVTMVTTANPENDKLQRMRKKHHGKFLYWINLTSNHGKEVKIFFPVKIKTRKTVAARLRSGSQLLFNLGAPLGGGSSTISVMMCGGWAWNRYADESGVAVLKRVATRLYGPKAGGLFEKYGPLV